MMNLNHSQLQSLQADLRKLANIEYDEVMAELLDHYASLTEQKMANGMSFDEASKWAWAKLGSGTGLLAIQDNYVKNFQRQIRARHLAILKSYFRWPAFVTTALIGLLVYLLVPMLPVRVLLIGLLCVAFIPAFLLLNGCWNGHHRSVDSQKIVWKYIQHKGLLPINLFQIGLNLSNSFVEDRSTTDVFLQVHSIISVIICLFLLLYSISFVQLYRQKYIVKPA